MLDKRMQKAMLLGTFALAWTVPSLNLAGIIAFFLSWVAYIKPTRKAAAATGAAYVAALILTAVTAFFLLRAGGLMALLFGSVISEEAARAKPLTPAFRIIFILSLIGSILYIAAAIVSFRCAKALPKENKEQNGFFD